jgi:hypothetical protein
MASGAGRRTAEARILSAIKEAISLDEAGQTVLAIRLLTPLLREFPAEPGILIYLAWCLRRGGRDQRSTQEGETGRGNRLGHRR